MVVYVSYTSRILKRTNEMLHKHLGTLHTLKIHIDFKVMKKEELAVYARFWLEIILSSTYLFSFISSLYTYLKRNVLKDDGGRTLAYTAQFIHKLNSNFVWWTTFH